MIYSPRGIKEILRSLGLRPSRKLGQNFLLSRRIAERVADLVLDLGTEVVEVGAGLGALTVPLLEKGADVTAIEIDRRLCSFLEENLFEWVERGRLRVLCGDALSFPFPGQGVVAGNIPYSITSPLIEKMIGEGVEGSVLMVQLEVAKRILSPRGTGDYGRLTVWVRANYKVEGKFVVPASSFFPRPEVDSMVLVLERSPIEVGDKEVFERLLRLAFSSRRKKLKNSIPERWARILASGGLGGMLEKRPQEIGISEFAAASRILSLHEDRYENAD